MLEAHLAEVAEVLPPHLELRSLLGTSSDTSLFGGTDRSRGVDVVVKVCRGPAAPRVGTEARALARLGPHPHLLALVATGHARLGDPPGEVAWIVTVRAPGGPLARRIGAPAQMALRWAVELAGSLAHVHGHGVVHGDVTPTNVLLDHRDSVLLGDFGAALLTDDADVGRSLPGHTPAYSAPERRLRELPGPPSDVYGLASTILMVCGDHLDMPSRSRRLLHRCLGPAPQRPSAAELARRLTVQRSTWTV